MFQVSQVGDEAGAEHFINGLHNDAEVGRVVYCTSGKLWCGVVCWAEVGNCANAVQKNWMKRSRNCGTMTAISSAGYVLSILDSLLKKFIESPVLIRMRYQ